MIRALCANQICEIQHESYEYENIKFPIYNTVLVYELQMRTITMFEQKLYVFKKRNTTSTTSMTKNKRISLCMCICVRAYCFSSLFSVLVPFCAFVCV